MTNLPTTRFLRTMFKHFASDERGAVIPMVALLLPILLGLAALALDVGTMYANRRSLQIAADAAALAAAGEMRNQLLDPSGSYNPAAKALDFAKRNGVAASGSACTTDYKPTVVDNSSPALHTWQVRTSRLVPLNFASALGIPAQCVQASARSVAELKMMDIMLSLDTTKSMDLSGTDDFAALRQAVSDFVTEMNPDPTDPTSPKIGIARFAGIKCNWVWNSQTTKYDCPPATVTDDKTVLTDLTFDQNKLQKIATGGGTGSCPSGVSPYGCPLNSVDWMGIPTGTKLPNAVSVLNNGSYFAWDTSHGGRNNASGEGTAKKILVIMTDGFNEDFNIPYFNPPPNENIATWNTQMQTFGDQLKAKGVDIYTVGFFCTPYSASSTSVPDKWCKSTLANTSAPHPCPGPNWPTTSVAPSEIDNRLRDWSSSAPGTCDHYFPISKRESLPALFRALAARLMRLRLTQ